MLLFPNRKRLQKLAFDLLSVCCDLSRRYLGFELFNTLPHPFLTKHSRTSLLEPVRILSTPLKFLLIGFDRDPLFDLRQHWSTQLNFSPKSTGLFLVLFEQLFRIVVVDECAELRLLFIAHHQSFLKSIDFFARLQDKVG